MSSRYLLTQTQAPMFTASGLDAAHRVNQRVSLAIREALLNDPEVIAVEKECYLRETLPRCTGKPGCRANLHDYGCAERAA